MRYFHSGKLQTCDAGAVDIGTIDIINKVCGPLRTLTAQDVHVRGLIILGEEPTSKGSIHPRSALEALAALLPKAPMMVGHVWDAAPWGKVFEASVLDNQPGYKGAVLKLRYFFLKDASGDQRAQQIDSGIHSEGSIAYFFGSAKCSICGMPLGECGHRPLEKYNGQVCYWIPGDFTKVAEVSFPVFRGAYDKTQATLNTDEEKGAIAALDTLIAGVKDVTGTSGSPAVDTLSSDAGTDSGGDGTAPASGTEPPPAAIGSGASSDAGAEPPVKATPDLGNAAGTGSGDGAVPGETLSSADQSASEVAAVMVSGDSAAPPPVIDTPAPVVLNPSPEPAPASPAPIAPAESAAAATVVDAVVPPVSVVATLDGAVVIPATLPVTLSTMSIGVFLGNVKPAKSGAANNEYFQLDAFKNLPAGSYAVQPKYDGVYAEIHVNERGEVAVLTPGADQAEKFSNLVASAEKLPKGTVLSGEIVKYRGRQRMDHTDVMAYINGKGPYEDYHFKFKLFDVPMYDGKDLREQPYSDRLKIINDIGFTGTIHAVKTLVVAHKAGMNDVVNAIVQVETREGAMVKALDAKFLSADAGKYFKFKRQSVIDALVKSVHDDKGGAYTYECEVGTADEREVIGTTYATSIKAAVGDIIEVSVDHVTYDTASHKVSWYAPKVISVRADKKQPDPLSTIERIAAARDHASMSTNVIQLGDVVPRLKRYPHAYRLSLAGGLVERGSSLHDVDLFVDRELTDDERAALEAALGEELAESMDLNVCPGGPDGPAIELAPDMTPAAIEALAKKWKYANRFVIQRHWWGNKVHYDIRFGSPTAQRMWGWTLFTELKEDGTKTRTVEKMYHDPKWLTFEGDIPVGQPGNPTKNLVAHMEIVDSGTYEFVKRTSDFLEVILHGKHHTGRYVWRKISVQHSDEDMLAAPEHEGGVKSRYIWIVWKPKEQTKSGATNQIGYKVQSGTLLIWETDLVDAASLVPGF